MLTDFKAIEGQSIIDLVLNMYGSINQLGRLITDNGIEVFNGVTSTGAQYVYDPEFIEDQNLYDYVLQYGTRFRTGIESVKYLLTENSIILQPESGQNFII